MSQKMEIIDLGIEPENRNFDQKESVAFLLGAGFSIPMGYPTGSEVNKGILHFDKQPVAFSPAGEMAINKDGTKPDFGYTNVYDRIFSLCKDLIAAYSEAVVDFDYERFMDVLRSKNLYTKYSYIFDKYITDTESEYYLMGNLPDIYSQMVAHLVKDADNTSWYEGMATHIGPYLTEPRSSYNRFLQYLSNLK